MLRFRVFQAMREIRDFQLVLCVDAWDAVGEYAMGVAKRAVAAEKAKRRFDDTYVEPLVVYSPRGPRPQKMESWCSPYCPHTGEAAIASAGTLLVGRSPVLVQRIYPHLRLT